MTRKFIRFTVRTLFLFGVAITGIFILATLDAFVSIITGRY